ncbi:glycosyltransferase family 4 protein [Demequina muriae]|uniref:glycosyltransferase family 4 protein n=1 Tax=Demequina muriae TaxID=3051664 RepID=UPI0026068351|nr:glycosyltransferase family 4 protein [Demequina sp. EGI L300058]
MRVVYHVITPGDHFSPRTGSAIPTVVDGLARASAHDGSSPYRHVVVLDRTTYTPRYDSAEALEYSPAPAPSRADSILDYGRAVMGRDRAALLRPYAPVMAALADAPAGIVVAHNAPFLAPALARTPHRIVLHAHNALPASMRPHEARRWVGSADALICVSSDHAAATRARVPAGLRDAVHVVRHGVDPAVFAPRERQQSPIRFVFVGRTIPHKGADVLVEAAQRLARRDIEVVVVGSHGFDPHAPLTGYERALRDAAATSVTPITFRPFTDRSDLPGLLGGAHALVVPSRWREPAGLTVGEGMASGAVVIASATGGIPELLGDAGVLVAPDSATALAAAMTRVADDVEFRAAKGRQARERAEAHDWSWSWRQMRDVLDGI